MNDTTLPRNLEALGAELDRAWDRRYGPAPLRSRTRGHRTHATLVLAAAAVLLAAFLARGTGPGAVDRALAAAGDSPAAAIVHFASVTRAADGTVLERTELWGATSPPYARRSILQGAGAAAIEQGARGDELTQFDPAGVVYVRTIPGGAAEGTRPADFAAGAARVKAYLREGNARDLGEVAAGGATVHRFVLAPPGGGTCTYDVRPDTYVGISLSCTGTPQGATSERWEYLPRQGNERLLSVAAQHPTAKIDRAAAGQCGTAPHTVSTPPCVFTTPGG
jgi:hypothetical protein